MLKCYKLGLGIIANTTEKKLAFASSTVTIVAQEKRFMELSSSLSSSPKSMHRNEQIISSLAWCQFRLPEWTLQPHFHDL